MLRLDFESGPISTFGFCCLDSIMPLYHNAIYRKVPKFSDTRKLCCNLLKIQEKRPNLWVFRQKVANGIENSGDRIRLLL